VDDRSSFLAIVEKLPKDDAVVLYVGANTGQELHCFYEHMNSATIYAFEANPTCISFLQITVQNLNFVHAGKNITVEIYNKAVCNQDGEIILHHDPGQGPAHQSATIMPLPPAAKTSRHHRASLLTPAIMIDTFVSDNNIDKVDLLYADVEGAQAPLLSGAAQTLPTIDYVYIETQHLWDGLTHKQIVEELSDDFVVDEKYGCDTLFRNKKKMDPSIIVPNQEKV